MNFLVTMAALALLFMFLLISGYLSLLRAVISVFAYSYCWYLYLACDKIMTGGAGIASSTEPDRTERIVTFFVIPTLYFFDRCWQRTATLLAIAGDIIIPLVYAFVLFPEGRREYIFSAEEIKVSLIMNMMGDALFGALMVYFNGLSSRVFEDLKSANETIESTAREKEAFFAMVSHEIRNPLQSLQGSVELLADRRTGHECSEESVPQLLEICKNCCALVINMVSNVLDMSKIAAGKMQLSPVSTDLREAINRILRVSRGRAQGKNLRLELECETGFPPAVEVDPQRLEQVVLNLVSNSVKFANAGRVVVKLSWSPFVADVETDVSKLVNLALGSSSWKQTMELAEQNSAAGTRELIVLRTPRLEHKYQCSLTPSVRRKLVESVSELNRLASKRNSVKAKGSTGIVKIEVMDTGIGIRKDNLARLFRPYQQANATISR